MGKTHKNGNEKTIDKNRRPVEKRGIGTEKGRGQKRVQESGGFLYGTDNSAVVLNSPFISQRPEGVIPTAFLTRGS